MSEQTLSVTLPVTAECLADLLVTAAEGGSSYWARFTVPNEPGQSGDEYTAVRVREHEAHSETAPAVDRIVRAADLLTGLQRLAACATDDRERRAGDMSAGVAMKHLLDALGALGDNGDATTADVVLQMALFGEVIYG